MDHTYKGAFLQFDITPNVSANNPALLQGMAGPPRQSIAVALPLSIEMCLLEDGHFTKLLFVTADIIGFDQSIVAEVRRHASQWGIDPEGVVLNASHTHYAPGTLSNMAEPLGPFYESYTKQILQIILSNLQNLYNRLEPCNIYHGKARARIGTNRRYPKDNEILFAPNPGGAYIEDTPFLKIDLLGTRKRILWINHGCHPTGMGTDTRISSDYPGYLKYALKHDGIADGVMFFQGAGGSSKEAQKGDSGWIFSCSVGDVCQNGYKLANIIKEALGKNLPSVKGSFYCRSKKIAPPLKKNVNSSGSARRDNDRIVSSNLNQSPQSEDLEIQLVSLSDHLNMLAFPSEPTAELAEQVQTLDDFSDHDFLLGYTNGLQGYLPTDRMIEEGGYETEQSHMVYKKTAPLAVGTEKLVIESVKYLLNEKKQVEKDNGFGRYHKTAKPRKAFFVLSAGRCGTMTLAHLLDTATNARVWHHPQPDPVKEALLAWWGKIDQALTFWKARSSIIHKTWAQGLIHGETDLLMTPFAKRISEEIPESKFVILVRDPRAFVRSGMRRNYYKGHSWDMGRLRPDESSEEYARWALLSQFEKVCWLWNETYQRILKMTKDLPEDRKLIVKFEKLLSDPETIEDLFAFLGLEGFDKNKITQILSKKYNAQQTGNFPFSKDWSDELKEQSEKLYGDLLNYFEYPEIEEFSSSFPKENVDIEKKEKPNLLFLELLYQSTGGHLDHIVSALEGKYCVKYLKTLDMNEARKAVDWADIVWLEWANQMAIHATNSMPEIAQKKVVCRLHGYEVFTNMPSKINWDRVDRLIFVANHKKDIFNRKFGPKPTQQIVIRNGVNLDKFSIQPNKKNTKKLVLLGHLNFRKGLPILLHFYQQLLKHDPSYYLYVRGEFQDPRLEMAAKTMIKELELEKKIEFVGWIKDLNNWFADKSHILSFSLEESFHYAIGNGMAAGLKPVIHAWNESREIWPNEYIFRNVDEFLDIVTDTYYAPEEYRQKLTDHSITAKDQIGKIETLLKDVVECSKSSAYSKSTIQTDYIPLKSDKNRTGKSENFEDQKGQSKDTQSLSREIEYNKQFLNILPNEFSKQNKLGLWLHRDEHFKPYMNLKLAIIDDRFSFSDERLIYFLQNTFHKICTSYFNYGFITADDKDTAELLLNKLNVTESLSKIETGDTKELFLMRIFEVLKEKLSLSENKKIVEIKLSDFLSKSYQQHSRVKKIYNNLKDSFASLWDEKLMSLFLIHGSMSTLDYTLFSDIDTQIFLADTVFTSEKELKKTSDIISNANKILKFYDPLQHHGFFISTDMDRVSYPQAYLPFATMECATALFGGTKQEFFERSSFFENQTAVWNLSYFFRKFSIERYILKTPFEMKQFLSRFSMLPVLFLELFENRYPYKRDSFVMARPFFSETLWPVYDVVSAARNKWVPDRMIHFNQAFYYGVRAVAEMMLTKLRKTADG